ncbi:MAG: sulfatase [Planctomycetaceae bacterium]
MPWLRFCAVLLPILLSGSPLLVAEEMKPNFIVIFCDNLGFGDIEPFGSKVHRTPCLNRMAAEGRKFTDFNVTAGVCTPSRASLLTGCYAQRVGMHFNPRDGQVLRPVSPYGLNPEEETIAEVLKSAGYATACIGKWHLGDQPDFLPTRQGFDSFYGIPYSDDMTADVGKRLGDRLEGNQWPPLPLMVNEDVVDAPVDRDLLTVDYTEKTIDFIEEHQTEPFFLYLPQAMPGSTSSPFASPRFKGKSANGPWGDSVEELDWSTGEILDKLVELGLDQRTLVIFTSDNGAPLAADVNNPSRGSNLPFRGRGYTTAEGAFRVPTIMWWPGHIRAGSACSTLTSTMDLLPTFASLVGMNYEPAQQIDGKEISSIILSDAPQEERQSPHQVYYYYAAQQLQAVRKENWKLFLPLENFNSHPYFKKGQEAKPLLFDLSNDSGSTTDVAENHPDIVADLMKLADAARQDLGDAGEKGTGQRPAGQIENPVPQVKK